MTTYGILTAQILDSTAADETIAEHASLEEARAAFERVQREPGNAVVASLVELDGAGPVLDSDGTEIAPTHAPCRTLETWKRPTLDTIRRSNSLDELLGALVAYEAARPEGDRTQAEESTMAELPTFGGEEPADPDCVWSWDATRLLVTHRPTGEYRIVPREGR